MDVRYCSAFGTSPEILSSGMERDWDGVKTECAVDDDLGNILMLKE